MNLYNIQGEVIGEAHLEPSIFSIEPNEKVVHELVVAEQAHVRQGSASTKTRAEVRGGGRKPRRQKGLGAARQGSIRAPQWVGGGVVHGPKPRDHSKKINKKARHLALRSILSSKATDNKIYILGEYNIKEPSTKLAINFIDNLSLKKPLFLLDDLFEDNVKNLYYSARNIKDVQVIDTYDLAAYWLLKYDDLVITKEALESLQEFLK